MTCECEVHGRHCPLEGEPGDLIEGGLSGRVIGNECLDWTSFGAQLEFCRWGTMVFIIEECTPNFKMWILEHIFTTLSGGLYDLHVRKFSPEDLGMPASRPRQYVIITRKDRFQVKVPFAGEEFERIFFRQRVLKGKVFCSSFGGPRERLNYERALLGRHGLALRQHTRHCGRRWVDMLGTAYRVRFQGYVRFAQRKGVPVVGLVDVKQTAGYCKRIMEVVPTLLRTSIVADLETGDLLLPSVHFDAMSIPVHPPAGVTYRVPFKSVLAELSYTEMKSSAGKCHARSRHRRLLFVFVLLHGARLKGQPVDLSWHLLVPAHCFLSQVCGIGQTWPSLHLGGLSIHEAWKICL